MIFKYNQIKYKFTQNSRQAICQRRSRTTAGGSCHYRDKTGRRPTGSEDGRWCEARDAKEEAKEQETKEEEAKTEEPKDDDKKDDEAKGG